MCMLCGETADQGRKEAMQLSDDLSRLSAHQHNLAKGVTKPHSEEAKLGADLARSIIRRLVAEYI